jgi:hypothetical protein
MKSVATAMMGSLAFLMTGCNLYVEKSKYEESQAQLVLSKKQLEETQKQLEEAKKKIDELSAHKFSTYPGGFRTWRFDSVTGDVCILLTTDSDWKNKKTKGQSCNCADTRQEYSKELFDAQPGAGRQLIIENWKPLLKDACGD